ncbi:MAG: DUF624 domain-containing protein [Clostridium sp.]|nr:DUF624 domain-containing protein [Clostridium sp.]
MKSILSVDYLRGCSLLISPNLHKILIMIKYDLNERGNIMGNKRGLIDNKLYSIINYIFYFFMINIFFLLVISPLIIYSLLEGKNTSLPVFLLFSILLGPAVATLCSVMLRVISGEDTTPFKDFFHFYKLNLIQGIAMATILNSLIAIGYVDMSYFNSNGQKILSYVFLVYIVLVLVIGFYIYPLIARYNLKIVHTFQMAIVLLFKKPYISLTSISIIIIVLGLIRLTSLSLVGVLFGASVIAYLIMKIEYKMIVSLESSIKEKYSN